MRGEIEFSTNLQAVDPDPTILVNDDWFTFRGKRFRSDTYYGTGETYGNLDDPAKWEWRRAGKIIKDDGEPRKDGALGAVTVPWEEVPLAVRKQLHEELVKRAAEVHAVIDAWVQAAAEQAEAVTS